MYCPNCSTEATTEQKFCRTCGMELHAVAELISEQSPTVKPLSQQNTTLAARQRAMLIWGFIITFGAAGVGASLKILAKDGIHPAGEFTPYVNVIAVLAAFFGMGLMCYPFLQMMPRNTRSRRPAPTPQSTIKLTPVLLAEEQPSVTEQTTEFLEASKARLIERDTAPQSE
jgi:hypothetical protein